MQLFLVVVVAILFLSTNPNQGVYAQYSDEKCYNTECDLSPDSLTNALGVSVPQTCVETDCGKRCFYTYVPECASENSPLVYDIHGYSSCPHSSAFYTGWKEIADEKCAVVVWPKGNVKAGETVTPCWAIPGGLSFEDKVTNTCCCSKNVPVINALPVEPEETQDLAFLRSIASYVVRDVPLVTNGSVTIDTKRIYMAGHSNGCMASFGMAMEHSDLVAAVCCHAGALLTPPSENYSPTPTWFVHGTDDKTIPYYGATIEIPFLGDLFYPPQQDAFEHLRKLNGCSTVANTTIDDGFVLTTGDCDDEANVEFLSLSNVNHVPYSSTGNSFLNLFNTTYNTTLAAWDFCSSYQSVQEPILDPINESSFLSVMKSVTKHLI